MKRKGGVRNGPAFILGETFLTPSFKYYSAANRKDAICDTSNIPESGLSPIHHDPSSQDPTPENHDNHRGMSNTHKYQGRSSSHKDSGNKLVEALQLPGER